MGIFKKFVNQTRKPEGALGKMMLRSMNTGHSSLANWGFAHLPPMSLEQIVDLGCGGGKNAAELLKAYPSAHVTAVDYSPLSVETAAEYNREAIAAGRAEAKPVGDADRTAVLAENVYIPPAEFFTGEKRASVLAYLKNKIDTSEDERRRREYISCALVLERKNYGLGADGRPRGGENVYVAAARFGDVRLVFLPFEYAQKDAALLKEDVEKAFGGHCIVVCYSNGYDGYLPSGRPLDQDSGYEDMASGYRSDAKELTREALMGLLTKLI